MFRNACSAANLMDCDAMVAEPSCSRSTGARRPRSRRCSAAGTAKEYRAFFTDETLFGQHGTLTKMWARKGSRATAVKHNKHQ